MSKKIFNGEHNLKNKSGSVREVKEVRAVKEVRQVKEVREVRDGKKPKAT